MAYIPKDKVIGLSKINRIVQFFAQRPQVQERLTQQVLVALQTLLGTTNVAVSIDAVHYCVKARGGDDSLMETPHRIAKMYVDEIFSGLDYANFPKITVIENKMKVDEMVTVRDITLTSTCEHHFVIIDGKVGRITCRRMRTMSTLSQEAALVHEALLARGLETPLRAPVREMDSETRKREIAGHMTQIMQLLNLDLAALLPLLQFSQARC
ncbi:hypothetical protein CRX72_22420 [Pantoea sp. BRM17]|nr:hypothetical protein CRX72_22420 [Pantoea sp. BRM17]